MIDREWIQTEGRLPDSNREVVIRGLMTARATWNMDEKQWEMCQDAKIQCNVIDWKEVPPPKIEAIEPEVLPAE